MIQVQLDPAAALADHAEGLCYELKTIEIAYNLVKGAGDVQIVTGKESGNISRRPNPVKGVARGYRWRSQLLAGEVGSGSRAGPQSWGRLSIYYPDGARGVFSSRHNPGHPRGPADRRGDF
jgi:hypothetical protein